MITIIVSFCNLHILVTKKQFLVGWLVIMFRFILPLITVVTSLKSSLTSKHHLQNHIDAGIHFMCSNQFTSNGQFLYELKLHQDKITIDLNENNMPRQAGALYSVALYFRLYHTNHDIIDQFSFSIIECIDNSIQYLTSMSIPVEFEGEGGTKNDILNHNNELYGKLIDGNVGATALGIMGMIEICVTQYNIIQNNLCISNLDIFKSWIKGLISMRNYKLKQDDNILSQGAFPRDLNKLSESSEFDDGEGYVAFARLMKFQNYLFDIFT